MALRKNDQITLHIDDLTHQGQGVGRYEEMAVFVPDALPNETVQAHIIKVQKRYAIAKIIDIITPSPFRTEPACPVFGKCGGCSLQHLDYEKQLEQKRNWVVENLRRVGGIEDAEQYVQNTVGMEVPFRYRNKASFPFAMINDCMELGFYAQNSHRLIPIDDCILQKENIMQTMRVVRDWARKFSLTAYDENIRRGILRHLVIREGNINTKRMIVTLVTHTTSLPHQDELIEMLKKLPFVNSVVHNIQSKSNNTIFGNQSKLLYGDGFIQEQVGDLIFDISEKSFLQVNEVQTKVLYQTAIDYANIQKNDIVVDAYCGTGTISLLMAQKARQVVGVEIVPEAIQDAKKNAQNNGFDNTEFYVAPAEEFLPNYYAKQKTMDVIVLDPPRKGCDIALLDAVLKVEPKRIVYVSCDSATWARDIKVLLSENQYRLVSVQPVDMFAQTTNIELVSLLER